MFATMLATLAALLQMHPSMTGSAEPAGSAGRLDCRWTANDHTQPGHLFGRLPPSMRSHLSDATTTIYPGHSAGFVAHPSDMLSIRPYESTAGAGDRRTGDRVKRAAAGGSSTRDTVMVLVPQGQCTATSDTDSDEGYFHSLPAPAVSDCCAACSSNPLCTFATWMEEANVGGKCWLKNATTLTPRVSSGTTLLTVKGKPAPPPPPVLYWQDAWERNLVTGPAAMAGLVSKELNGTQSGLLMIDYEPPFSASWNFSTDFSTKPEPLWQAKLASVHNQSFDKNWTELVGWTVPSGGGAQNWDDLTAAQQLSLQAVSWDFFCKQYFTAGVRAIKATLPENVQLSFWNWPNKFWFHAGAISKEQWMPLMDELGWLWAELPVFMPDLYSEFYSGDEAAKPSTLERCVTENASATRAYFQDNVNEALRLKAKFNPAAKVFLSVWWHYMCAQEVVANATAPPFVVDGNLAALFAATGHDGLAIWGSVGDAKGEDQDEDQVAGYLAGHWGPLVTAGCAPAAGRRPV